MLSVHEDRQSQQLQTPTVRLLVVDDFELWQTFVHNQFDREPNLRVIAFLGHGLEAVQTAKELQPDLIVLDIGLPKLNGIEAPLDASGRLRPVRKYFLSANADPAVLRRCTRLYLQIGRRSIFAAGDGGRSTWQAIRRF